MTYNLLYFRASSRPCTPTEAPSTRGTRLENIIKFVQPDILLVNELGSTPTNGDFVLSSIINTGGITKYNKAAFSNNSRSSIVNMLYFDTTKVDLARQDMIDTDLNGQDIVRVLDVYTLYYKDPKLKLGADTVYLTIVGAHLKASSGTADQLQRNDAAEALIAYLGTNFPSSSVLFAGDFNIYRSNEPAYQTLTATSDTSVRFFDPINQPGTWNNASFSAIHTQSTHSSSSGCHAGGGCDDRFDFILASKSVMQGNKGVKYVLNSYKTVGQDGNHYNQSINAGTNSSAPANIITDLYELSDHLPVTAEFEFKGSNISIKETALKQENITFNNPIQAVLTIRIGQPLTNNVSIEVFDLSGKRITTSRVLAGERQVVLNSGNWNNGLYLLRFSDKNGSITTRKLIKR